VKIFARWHRYEQQDGVPVQAARVKFVKVRTG